MKKTFKTNKDASFKIPTVKICYDNGVCRILKKDLGIRLEIIGSLATNILPSYKKI
jgi:hypothetical protein